MKKPGKTFTKRLDLTSPKITYTDKPKKKSQFIENFLFRLKTINLILVSEEDAKLGIRAM